MNDSTNTDKPQREDKLRHFSAGMIRWLLSSSPAENWQEQFSGHCQKLTEESLQLAKLPSENEQKSIAVVKAVPGVALFWLGLYTGGFWLIPGVALGVFSSYVIANCVNEVFSSGKDGRFFRTMIYYLLRMENADGVISSAELASLRAIIEFIPTSAKEKELWLKATQTPEGYRELAPEGSLSDEEKEKILSACWSLALCDGLEESEQKMFYEIGSELGVGASKLKEIIAGVEQLFAEHEQTLWQAIKIAKMLNPNIIEKAGELYKIAALVALKPIEQEAFNQELNKSEIAINALPEETLIDRDRIILASYLLARIFSSAEADNSMAVREAFLKLSDEDHYSHRLEPMINSLNASLKLL